MATCRRFRPFPPFRSEACATLGDELPRQGSSCGPDKWRWSDAPTCCGYVSVARQKGPRRRTAGLPGSPSAIPSMQVVPCPCISHRRSHTSLCAVYKASLDFPLFSPSVSIPAASFDNTSPRLAKAHSTIVRPTPLSFEGRIVQLVPYKRARE